MRTKRRTLITIISVVALLGALLAGRLLSTPIGSTVYEACAQADGSYAEYLAMPAATLRSVNMRRTDRPGNVDAATTYRIGGTVLFPPSAAAVTQHRIDTDFNMETIVFEEEADYWLTVERHISATPSGSTWINDFLDDDGHFNRERFPLIAKALPAWRRNLDQKYEKARKELLQSPHKEIWLESLAVTGEQLCRETEPEEAMRLALLIYMKGNFGLDGPGWILNGPNGDSVVITYMQSDVLRYVHFDTAGNIVLDGSITIAPASSWEKTPHLLVANMLGWRVASGGVADE